MGKNRRHNAEDDLKIVYEDQWLIVVEKPSGLLSMSTGRSGEETAYSMLTEYAGRVFIVHRLDRDTSGLLVFAKDFDTKEALQSNWDEAVLERKYTAVLEGEIADEEGWIETWLLTRATNPKSRLAKTGSSHQATAVRSKEGKLTEWLTQWWNSSLRQAGKTRSECIRNGSVILSPETGNMERRAIL